MKWININDRLPKLDVPLLITVYYNGDNEPTVTESELWNDPCSLDNPCFSMGSAVNYTVVAWAYQPQPAKNKDGIKFLEREWSEIDRNWKMPRLKV